MMRNGITFWFFWILLIMYLRHLISLHHLEFKRLYPHNTITPKMHFLVHYPELIARYVHLQSYVYCNLFVHIYNYAFWRYGPLSCVWCMRFEAKNSYFKKIGQAIGNYKNIAKTVATCHQRLCCYNLAGDVGNFISHNMLTGPGTEML